MIIYKSDEKVRQSRNNLVKEIMYDSEETLTDDKRSLKTMGSPIKEAISISSSSKPKLNVHQKYLSQHQNDDTAFNI